MNNLKIETSRLTLRPFMESDAAAVSHSSRQTIMSQSPKQKEAGTYHIDIPNTIDVQRKLLSNAGFQTVDVLEAHIRPRWSGGILKAGK